MQIAECPRQPHDHMGKGFCAVPVISKLFDAGADHVALAWELHRRQPIGPLQIAAGRGAPEHRGHRDRPSGAKRRPHRP
jgi:hypothetical protein